MSQFQPKLKSLYHKVGNAARKAVIRPKIGRRATNADYSGQLPDYKVKALYEALRANGYTEKDAAKEAQARTGLSVVTGRPFKQKKLKTRSLKQLRNKNLKEIRGMYG